MKPLPWFVIAAALAVSTGARAADSTAPLDITIDVVDGDKPVASVVNQIPLPVAQPSDGSESDAATPGGHDNQQDASRPDWQRWSPNDDSRWGPGPQSESDGSSPSPLPIPAPPPPPTPPPPPGG